MPNNGNFNGPFRPTPQGTLQGGFIPTPNAQTYGPTLGPNKNRTALIKQLMGTMNKAEKEEDGKINLDTAEKPVVIWENSIQRVVLSSTWDLEVETNTGKDSMGVQTWVRESNQGQRERVLSLCCVALLPERIAESVVDE